MTAGLVASVRLERPGFSLAVDLEVAPGETVAVVGPNGAGKSTLVRALAGLEKITAGSIVSVGVVVDAPGAGVFVPPHRRSAGVVFQGALLFPHLRVVENVAFGLRCGGANRHAARLAAGAWLDRLGVGALADAKPASLSGGEAQRVALARAIATDPSVLLLDEPFSALDASTRVEVRRTVAGLFGAHRGARVLVTHDPVDLAALADRIVVIEHGAVVQEGTLVELSARPASRFVADLVGVNVVRGRGAGRIVDVGGASISVADEVAGDVAAVIHPRSVALHRERPEGGARNVWQGRVTSVEGGVDRVRVRVDAAIPLVAEVTTATSEELRLRSHGEIWVSVKATEITCFPA